MMNPLLPRLALALLLLAPVLAVPGPGVARPARAVDRIGFTKRQDGWIGGSALHASGCPKDLQDCGNSKAQNWCCPKDTVCKSDYCCPTDSACGMVVKTFPSCADPSWTLCSWDYYFGPEYYCCRPGEQCYMAVGGNAPACGPGNLPVQSSQMVSTVSPFITRSVSGGPSVTPSITRGNSGGGSPTGGSQKPTTTDPAATAPPAASSGLSGGAIGGIVAGVIAGLSLIAIVGILGARYGSKRAIQNYNPGPAGPPAPPLPGYVPEPAYVWKPEEQQQMQEQQMQQQQQQQNPSQYRPGQHVELDTEGR